MKNKVLEKIFQEKLRDLRLEPSERAKNLVYQKIKKRGRIILYKRFSIAASMVLISSIGIFYFLTGTKNVGFVQEKVENPGTEEIYENKDINVGISSSQENETPVDKEIRSNPLRVNEDNPANSEISNKDRTHSERLVENTKPEIVTTQDSLRDVSSGSLLTYDTVSASEAGIALAPDAIGHSRNYTETVASGSPEEREPLKITIEYIASGSRGKTSPDQKSHVGELYSKMNQLVYPEEVMGDIRTFKDQLFAFDFINVRKIETQKNKEK